MILPHHHLVLESWKRIEPRTPEAVALTFEHLFALDPGLRLNFPGDHDREGKRLFSVISTSVRMLDAIEDVVPVLGELARRYEQKGLDADDYGTLGVALVGMMGEELGPDFDAATREAWVEVWSLLSSVALESRLAVA